MVMGNNPAVLRENNFSSLKSSFEILNEKGIPNIIEHVLQITHCDISWIKNNIKLTRVLFKCNIYDIIRRILKKKNIHINRRIRPVI